MAERKDLTIVSELANLLRKNGDKILSGESKLTLTTQSLSCMNVVFRRYSESRGNSWDAPQQRRDERRRDIQQIWQTNVQFLHDFITKTVSVKITHGSQTMQGPIFVSRFKNLRVLELRKIPMHMIEGLQKLRGQLTTVIASRCLQNIQDLLETCGGDQSSPMSWPELSCLLLSYNDISKLDSSLRLSQSLEILDLSHNGIERVENYLEYLTQLTRLNLSFNTLDTIPVLALSVRPKLRTLSIRNNNLDNLEGVSEFVNLEELDVSENCLCDHKCLEPLVNMHKLHMLGLTGNPLAFHRDHRSRTLIYLSDLAVNNGFVLDGKKFTSTEIMSSQSHIASGSRRSSAVVSDVQKSPTSIGTRIAHNYSFAESDDIATSIKVGSPSKRKVRRKKSRSRTKLADDVDSALCPSGTEISSPDSSRAPSPERIVEGRASTMSTKEEIQVLRDHYGVNWLQVMATRSSADRLSNRSISPQVSPGFKVQTTSAIVHHYSPARTHTEDDLYLNEGTADVHNNPGLDTSVVAPSNSNHDIEDDIVVLEKTEKDAEPAIPSSSSGEIYNTLSPSSEKSDEGVPFKRMNSSKGAEWQRSTMEQEMYYGAESEPFIMMLLEENLRQLFVSTNQRYIIEKDLEGHVVEMLDMKCLKTFTCHEEEITHVNLIAGTVLPVIRMKFDYVKKDRRERNYVMESMDFAKEFLEILTPVIQARIIEDRLKGMLQCLKCSVQFHRQEARKKNNSKSSSIYSKDDEVKFSCPQCSSDMVVELDLQEMPTSNPSTPIGSLPTSSTEGGATLTTMLGSPVAKSTPYKSDDGKTSNQDIQEAATSLRRRSNAFSESMTRSDGLNTTLTNSSNLPKSNSTGHNIDRMKDLSTDMTSSGIHREQSWSDVRKSVANSSNRATSIESDISIITSDSRVNEKTTSRMNSAESDISILTSDSSSITVISDKSGADQPSWLANEVSALQNEHSNRANLQLNVTAPSTGKLLKEISEEGEATPYGSPLSTSVCSSMVSSVYENSLTANSNENLATDIIKNQTISSVTAQENDSENNNEGSIYDSKHIYDNKNGKIQENSDVIEDIYSGTINKTIDALNDKTREIVPNDLEKCDTPTGEDIKSVDSLSVSEKDSDLMTSILDGTWLSSYDQSCDIDYTKIDHKLKLYLVMHVLEEEDDEIQYAVHCDIIQYLKSEPYPGYLVLTTKRILVVEITSNSETMEEQLTCVENQPITELQYIDIGLGYQSFRFEFETECSSFTFCISDEGHCKQLVTIITNVVQDTALSTESKLEGISKNNGVTLGNLQDVVWSPWKQDLTEEEEEFVLVKYLSGTLKQEDSDVQSPVGLAIMPEDLCLVKVNHQWPLPRLQAPLSDEVKGQQFQLIDHQRINNIATVEVCERLGTKTRITFFNEESQNEAVWILSMTTANNVKSLIKAVKEPWEAEFSVPLDIVPVSFENSVP